MTLQAGAAARALGQHEVVTRVRRAVEREQYAQGATIVAAVSGGRDSMALMVALAVMAEQGVLGSVVVAHVHHHRRAAADAELETVRRAASDLDLAFEAAHLDGDPSATPADLRAARYAELAKIARDRSAVAVATGHQAEDQLETVLLAIVRGAGPRGLIGMQARRVLEHNIDLIRPMLEVSRLAAADLCHAAALRWCDDPTNSDPETLRGALRRDVIPALRNMRSGVAMRLSESTPLRAAAADALDRACIPLTDGAWVRQHLTGMDEGLRRASVHRAAACLCDADTLSSSSIQAVSAAIVDHRNHRRTFELGGNVTCVVDAESVRIETGSERSD